MNKKVLTLCAGFLLAGGMYANAQYVKVDPANLLDGEYVLANAAGDSIVTFTEGVADSWDNVLVKAATVNEAGDSETVTLTKSGNYWAVTYQGRCIYVHNDNVAYTALGNQTMDIKSLADSLVTFQTNSDKTVTGGTAQARQYLTRTEDALVKGFSKAQTSSQFALYAKLAEAPDGETIANIDEMEQTFLLMIDNQYVGLASETTRAAVADNSGLTLVDEKPANEDGFVWVVEANGAYKNLKSGQYLAVTEDGKLTLSETATADNTVSYNGNGLLIGETLVGAGMVLESNTPLPIDITTYDAAESDAEKVTLVTIDGTVISADGTLVTYNENDAVETVWTLSAVPVGTAVGDNQDYEIRLTNPEVEGNDHYLVINGQIVTVDGITCDKDGKFSVPSNGVVLKAGNDYVTLQYNATTQRMELGVTPVRGQATEFGLGDIKKAFVNVATLLQRNAKSFTIEIAYDKDGDQEYETDLTSIFEGELIPVQFEYDKYNSGATWYTLANGGKTKFMLINENQEILALNTDPDKIWSSGAVTHAYPLELISAKEYVTDLKEAQAEGREPYYKTMFSFQYTPGTDASIVTSIDYIFVDGIQLGCYTDTKKVAYLAGEGDTGLAPVKVTLAGTTLVDYKSWLTTPSYYKVEVANANKKAQYYGKVLGQKEDGTIGFVAPTKTDITKPEGEFAIRYVAATGTIPAYFEFKNRENKETYSFEASKLYEVDMAKHLFAYRDNRYDLMDTLKITPINDYDPSDGFKRFTAADLNANTYNVSMNLVDQSYLYIVENHDDKHRIGLDREEATDWRIEMPTVRLEDVTGDLLRYVPDTVTVDVPIHYWVSINGSMKEVSTDMKEDYKGKYYNPKATLKIPTYIFKNTATDEYISGDSDSEEAANSYYYCPFETSATRMALKIVGDSTLNLIPVYNYSYLYYNWSEPTVNNAVSESYYENYAAGLYLSDQKIIGGTTAVEGKGVLKDVTRFEATSNDLFLIEPSEAPTYKTLAQDNKIIISRVENNDEVIYEDSLFAGIDNRLAYDINPTLYVDTAYVNRPGNYRYEYLLSVRPLRTDSIDDCNNPNHEHPRTAFTEGDFLVVMRDSMDVEDDKNVHNNKYAYNGQPKLAFVSGIHQNDTLYYTNAAGEIIAKSEVGNADYNFAKFAFKMINEDENEFVVETAYGYDAVKWINGEPVEYEVSKGYLKWDNGHLVVTQNLDEAERFTMEDSELEATANESITAEGAVSVVATDGAVIIKGAEGKNVVIATILGKVVANETINSDNETIAVPAGIAVVSVDGESFKVVVK